MMIRSHCAGEALVLALGAMLLMLSHEPAAYGQTGAVELVGELALSHTAEKIQLEGDRLYVQVDGDGVYVLDVSDPAAPVLLGTIAEIDIRNFAVKDEYLICASLHPNTVTSRATIYDVSNPQLPISRKQMTEEEGAWSSYRCGIIDDMLVLCRGDLLKLYDIADISEPSEIDRFDLARDDTSPGLIVNGRYLFRTTVNNGLYIFDILEHREIRCVGFLDSGSLFDVAIENNLMILAEYKFPYYNFPSCPGIRVYDFNNPSVPVPLGAFQTRKAVKALDTDGWLVYAANDTAGLRIFDISDPAHPKIVAEYATDSAANDVIVRNGRAYLSTDNGIIILHYTGGQPVLEQNAIAVSQTVPHKLIAGQSVSASVTVRNSGQTTWYEPEFKLALLNEDSPLWQYEFPRLHLDKGDPVTPGETFTFTLPLKAPSQPGLYTIELQMVEEFVEFFGDKLDIVVEVIANSQAQNAAWSPYE